MRISMGFAMSPGVTSARKATNITLSTDVLMEARALGINISQACDRLLRDEVKRERERRWREENARFIEHYNRVVDEEGLPLAEWRSF